MREPQAVGKVRLALARVTNWVKRALILSVTCAFIAVPLRFSSPTVSSFTVSFLEDMIYTFSPDEFDAVFSDTVDNVLEGVVLNALPQNGSLALNGQVLQSGDTVLYGELDSFSYSPQTDYTGFDSLQWFGVTQTDQNTDTVYLYLEVKPSNDAPTVNAAVYLISEDNRLSLAWSTLNSQVFVDIDEGDQLQALEVTQLPQHGALYLFSADGDTTLLSAVDSSYQLTDTDTVGYMPDRHYNGSDLWRWSMSDGLAYSSSDASISVTILAEEDPAEVSLISLEVGITNSVSIPAADFEAAFFDPEGVTLTALEITSVPTLGTLTLADTVLSVGDVLELSSAFTLTYSADSGMLGEDVWMWEANPGQANATASGNVHVTIFQPNRSPEVVEISTTLNEDTPELLPFSFFLSGVTDPDGDQIQSIEFLDATGQATWALDDLIGDTLELNQGYGLSTNDGLYFLPENNYYGELTLGWRVTDSAGNTSEVATATINVLPVNDEPGSFQFVELGNDTLEWEGNSFSVRWTSATDVDMDPVTYIWYLNLRDTVVSISADTDTAISVNTLSGSFLNDPDEYLMWVVASDGLASTRSPSAIFQVINPSITGLSDSELEGVRIYPNPVSNWLYVTVPDVATQIQVNLWGTNGRVLGDWEYSTSTLDNRELKINLSEVDHHGAAILRVRLFNETGSIGAKSTLLMINK